MSTTRPDPEGSGTVEIDNRRCPRLRVCCVPLLAICRNIPVAPHPRIWRLDGGLVGRRDRRYQHRRRAWSRQSPACPNLAVYTAYFEVPGTGVVVFVAVVVVFTLNRSSYPTTSAIPPFSFLILHPINIIEIYKFCGHK